MNFQRDKTHEDAQKTIAEGFRTLSDLFLNMEDMIRRNSYISASGGLFSDRTYNLLRKNERLEDTFETMDNELLDYIDFVTKLELDLKRAFDNMKKADSKGGFESDDEVGQTFEAIKNIISELEEKYGKKKD